MESETSEVAAAPASEDEVQRRDLEVRVCSQLACKYVVCLPTNKSSWLFCMLVLTHHDVWPGSLLGCDLLLSLFFTALSSYRRATICQPFPSFFSSGASHTKIKEFDQLVRTTLQLLPTTRASLMLRARWAGKYSANAPSPRRSRS